MTIPNRLDPAKVTILFGAGISRPGPTNLPLANDVLRVIQTELSVRASNNSKKWQAINMPQFEVIMDCIRAANSTAAGRLLTVFQKTRPNPNHRLLARLGTMGCWLVTTNFDTNVETAIKNLGARVRSLTNVREARAFETRNVLVPILKLHGCVSSPKSIVATMTGLQRRGSIRSPHLLSPGRQKALGRFLKGKICFVIGYSGSDTLDILPALRRIKDCRIIRVQHDQGRHLSLANLRASVDACIRSQIASRGGWFDQDLSGDTTRFLINLSHLCGLEPAKLKSGATKDPDLTPVREAIRSMSVLQAEKTFSYLKHGRGAVGEEETKARKYLARLRRGIKPDVLAGGTVDFTLRKFRIGRKFMPGFEFRLGSLTSQTRARVCYETGKALQKSNGRERRAARAMLGQAINLWTILNKTNQRLRAERILERLTANSKKNTGR